MNASPLNPAETADASPSRRTIVAGAAWSIPVVAMAAAAPLAAASTTVCPTLPALSTWTRQFPVSGTPGLGSAGTRNGSRGEELFVTAEAAPDTGNLVIRFSTTMNVVAGRTYNFNFSYGSNYGNLQQATSTRAAVRLDVGPAPTTLFNGSSRALAGNTTIPNNPSTTYTNYGSSNPAYTATTTGSITVAYVFVMTATNTTTAARTDDIGITRPIITCS
ncbi:hypothetical protein [Pseudoclavibacter sp. VKM Ac-2888]|uniref:hypothetical protein n=1 Tax=Pseudoclavibacter sp. VKM Ac-2888 TaxID=2783830 RepID=UPI00188C8609|nr:hypothetical protein [Pseudoclavibacter sp. VKM Ac-2888]MBF4549478.1 hypothetical protein [Pseudoclavibacter sp. VKM Ac-2888]